MPPKTGYFVSTKTIIFCLVLFALILTSSILATYFGKPNQKDNSKNTFKPKKISIECWQSEPLKEKFLIKKDVLTLENYDQNVYTIYINDSIKYQQIDGFGASLTDSSAWLLKYKLSDLRRDKIFEELFGDSGLRISLLRQPIGSTDFSLKFWSFSETVNNTDDFSLTSFTLEPEDEYIRPMLDKALNVSNSRIKLFASPWSPPAWMKTSKSLIGGSLRKDCYDAYADYFIKYIKEYNKKSNSIYGITIQNEPYYEPANYPGMKMNEQEQIDFTRVLGSKLKQNGLNVKILVHDHNFDGADSAARISLETKEFISGAGFHHYNDENWEQLLIRYKDQVPDKDIWLTENGFGYWMGDVNEQFNKAIIRQLRTSRYWSKGFIMWNVALDENSKPNVMGDNGSNRGLLQISSKSIDDVKYETLFYAMGHFSKFVDTDSYRIDTNSYDQILENVAFLNPDKSIVIVLINRINEEKVVRFYYESQNFNIKIPSMSTSTFKFKITNS